MVELKNPFKKEKTVEEILKEGGVIKPLPEKKEKPPEVKEETTDSNKFLMDIEKLRTEIEMLKDAKTQTDDRLREVTERIGEFRSLIFQRETMIKESESKIRLLEEQIFNIKPSVIEKEMDLRKKEIADTQIRIEKIEAMSRDMLKDVKSSKEILESVKSVENIEKMLDEMKKSAEKAEKAKADVDRLAGKSESFYIEMEGRMKDFVALQAKAENLDGLAKEITKSVDRIDIRLASFAAKEDLDDFRKTIDSVVAMDKEKIDKRLSDLESVIKIPEEEANKQVESLREKERDVSKLLNDIEEKYKKAEISEKTYLETKENNENLLKEIADDINRIEEEIKFDMKSLPATIEEIKARLGRAEFFNSSLKEELTAHRDFLGENVKEISEMVEDVKSQEGFGSEEYKGVLQNQTEIMRSVLESIKKLNEKMNIISGDVKIFDLRIRFFENLNMLIRMQDEQSIRFYVEELNKTIEEMKPKNLWSESKKNMVLGLFEDIAYNWRENGYEEFAGIFEEELKKL